MKKSKKFLLLCILTALHQVVFAQLQIDNSLTHVDMVKSLEGAGVRFSNITTDCPGLDQMAQFDGKDCNINLNEGIILTSGDAFQAVGPNDKFAAGVIQNTNGDADLDIIAQTNTYDACAIEFDFETAGDSISFEFVFASEEYPKFVNSINDAFGFFISGPGINGPFSNNSENIALLPDGVTTVSIKNINNGIDNNGPCMNCSYYNANGTGDAFEPQYKNPKVVQYDGFTDVIKAKYPIEPCTIYHLKLVIADAKDKVQDSGVFLRRGSFQSRTANVVTRFQKVYEGCKDNVLTVYKAASSQQEEVEVLLSYSGSATNGVDYGIMKNGVLNPLPDSIILLPNVNFSQLPISIVADAIEEESETFVVKVENSDCFGNFSVSDSFEVEIREKLELELEGNSSICSGDSMIITANTKEKDLWFEWFPEKLVGDSTENTFLIKPDTSLEVRVNVYDDFGCMGSDTIDISVFQNPAEITFEYAQNEITNATKVKFFIDTSIFSSAAKYLWNFNDGSGEISTEKHPIHIFPGPGEYNIILQIRDKFSDSCDYVSNLTLNLGDIDLPNIFTPNNDGQNDYLSMGKLFNYNIVLYNRYGNIVFRAENYYKGFDGGDLPDGMYYYYVTTESGKTYHNWMKISR